MRSECLAGDSFPHDRENLNLRRLLTTSIRAMKRIDLIRAMVRRARELGIKITFHEGGNHTIVTVSNCVSQIPRHTEIPYGTARKIVKDLEQEFGERWLRV